MIKKLTPERESPKILIACEYSGIVRDAFTKIGFNAWSCDILPTEAPGAHIRGDVTKILKNSWDAIIAFPPCTYLCKAQMWRVKKEPGRQELQDKAIEFVKIILSSNARYIAIENPIGILSSALRPPDQIITPWHFGNNHDKDICLWLKNLPPLISTCYSTQRKKMKNHTNGRMNQELKSKIKSRFFPEIATAMATQWGPIINE